jgi:hypothetical protein
MAGRSLRAEGKIRAHENLRRAAKRLSQPRVVDPGDLTEEALLVPPALGHQEIEMRVKVDSVSKGLDSRNASGHQFARRQDFEMPQLSIISLM